MSCNQPHGCCMVLPNPRRAAGSSLHFLTDPHHSLSPQAALQTTSSSMPTTGSSEHLEGLGHAAEASAKNSEGWWRSEPSRGFCAQLSIRRLSMAQDKSKGSLEIVADTELRRVTQTWPAGTLCFSCSWASLENDPHSRSLGERS